MKKYTREMVLEQLLTGNNDFSFCDLSNLDLSGIDFTVQYPEGGHKHLINFQNANLSNSYLCFSKLYGANMIECNLTNADLTKAKLNQVNLHNANISNCKLDGAILFYTNIHKSRYWSKVDLSEVDSLVYNYPFEFHSSEQYQQILIEQYRQKTKKELRVKYPPFKWSLFCTHYFDWINTKGVKQYDKNNKYVYGFLICRLCGKKEYRKCS